MLGVVVADSVAFVLTDVAVRLVLVFGGNVTRCPEFGLTDPLIFWSVVRVGVELTSVVLGGMAVVTCPNGCVLCVTDDPGSANKIGTENIILFGVCCFQILLRTSDKQSVCQYQ